MPGLVDCGVVLRTALPSGNAFFTSFDQSYIYIYMDLPPFKAVEGQESLLPYKSP